MGKTALDLAWWRTLEKAWQGVFRKELSFTGDPTPAHLAALAAETHVNPAKSDITSLAPLAALPAITHCDFSGCKKLTTYAGLPSTMRTLTFHWIAMPDITWVDDLPNLEKVYCDKELQTKINRRLGANRRKRSR